MPLMNSLGALKQSPASTGSFPIRDGMIARMASASGSIQDAVIDVDGNMFAVGGRGSFAYLSKIPPTGTAVTFTREIQTTSTNSTASRINYSVCLDGSGNIYVGGSAFSGSTNPFLSAFVYKFDSAGTLLWSRYRNPQIVTPYVDARTQSVVCDSANNVYALSTNHGTDGTTQNQITKYNTSGTTQWARYYSGFMAGIAANMILDTVENLQIIMSGPNTTGNRGIFVAELSTAGAHIDAKKLTRSDKLMTALDIAVDINNDRYILGLATDDSAVPQYFIAKINSAGIVWQKYINNPVTASTRVGSLVIVGYDVFVHCAINGTANLYIKFDGLTGNLIWSRNLSGMSSATPSTSRIRFQNLNMIGANGLGQPALIGMPDNGSVPNDGAYTVGGIAYTYKKINLTITDADLTWATALYGYDVSGNSSTLTSTITSTTQTWTRTSTGGL